MPIRSNHSHRTCVKTAMKRSLAILFLAAPLALAQESLEIIPLRHRTADQVLPVLRPLLAPGGALSGQSNQLIVRTSAANLAQIRAALEAIDTPLRRLQILVRFDEASDAARQGARAGATLGSGGSSVDVRITDSRSASVERVDQRIQVLEGGRAFIVTGESRPLRQQNVVRTPSGTVTAESTAMQEIGTGVEVVPRLAGSTVYLDVAPRRETAGVVVHGSVQVQRVATSVSGRLGEWIELAGTEGAGGRDARGIASTRAARSRESRRIWVKVEEIRP